jgi:thiol-disulfide isomerase/thioredoxin
MKKLICILILAVVILPSKISAQDKHMTLSGKITNKNSDSLLVRSRKFSKKINVNADGFFSDTLKIKKGYYSLFDGKEQTAVYLENGFDLKVSIDTKAFDETIKYSGIGAERNNYLAQKMLLQEKVLNDSLLFSLGKVEFEQNLKKIDKKNRLLLHNTKKVDSSFIAEQTKDLDGFISSISGSYEMKKYIKEVLAKGKLSPKFVNYENNAGGTTSLDDFKGKYVYIDVWATWCGPCKAEIPFLKAVEKKYHDKNIVFVSISADKTKAHDTWKKMIQEKNLSGIQLISDADFNSGFMKDYKINAIPRFILIDPNGNIVSPNAPRPSTDELINLFDQLNI